MNHAERLAGLEATARDMERLGQPQRARLIRQVLVPYYNWLDGELRQGAKVSATADTMARGFGNMVEFFVAFTGGTLPEQHARCRELLSMIGIEVAEQHRGRWNRR